MSNMLVALYMMGGLGIAVGVGLALASKIFYVYVDPKILAIDDELPGANCGGCGLPGCTANAEAIVEGKAEPDSCVAAGDDVTAAIAEIMGVSIEAKEPDIALPGCTYGVGDAELKYIYDGMNDCRAAMMLGGGMKVCNIGCMGLGTCARVCPFDAIKMGPEGLPVVNEKRCTGCGSCERVCPKHIITLSSVTRRILKEFTTSECTTPCQRACPAGINICEYIKQITLGDYRKAVQVIKERNPFPTVIGRICPRPCETECRRQYVDEPVAINYLKRYAAEFEKENGGRILPYRAPDTGRSIAVIGGGVQGLSTAYFSARLGHRPTVYEASDSLGGLLRKAIAANRLPQEILNWDIDGVLEMGVQVETHRTLGKNITIETLFQQGHEAIFIASGGWDSRVSRGVQNEPESPIPGTHLLLDVIKPGSKWTARISGESQVVIYGGGKLGVDAAKLCKGKGAVNITIIHRETRDNGPLTETEIKAAEGEGFRMVYNTAVGRLWGRKNKLKEVEEIDLESSNSRKIPANILILSAGRFPELIFSKPKMEAMGDDAGGEKDSEIARPAEIPEGDDTLSWEAMEPYKKPAHSSEMGLFAQGDTMSDYSAVIQAIGAGRRAAVSIHQQLYGFSTQLPDNVVKVDTDVQNIHELEQVVESPRVIMPLSSEKDLAVINEIEKGFTQDMANKEADRCLQCGLICYKHTVEQG